MNWKNKYKYQCPVLKTKTSWKFGASIHELSGMSTSTLYPSLYPRDSNGPPSALADHLTQTEAGTEDVNYQPPKNF